MAGEPCELPTGHCLSRGLQEVRIPCRRQRGFGHVREMSDHFPNVTGLTIETGCGDRWRGFCAHGERCGQFVEADIGLMACFGDCGDVYEPQGDRETAEHDRRGHHQPPLDSRKMRWVNADIAGKATQRESE